MPDLIPRDAAKDAIEKAIVTCKCDPPDKPSCSRQVLLNARVQAALDAVPAAEPKTLLDPDEVKAVLAEALASQPMAKVWAEAAINAMCGRVVGEPAADGGERVAKLERQYNKHGEPVCPHCNQATNRTYAKHRILQCWSCGKYMPELPE